jgi:hypothetical protein
MLLARFVGTIVVIPIVSGDKWDSRFTGFPATPYLLAGDEQANKN